MAELTETQLKAAILAALDESYINENLNEIAIALKRIAARLEGRTPM